MVGLELEALSLAIAASAALVARLSSAAARSTGFSTALGLRRERGVGAQHASLQLCQTPREKGDALPSRLRPASREVWLERTWRQCMLANGSQMPRVKANTKAIYGRVAPLPMGPRP